MSRWFRVILDKLGWPKKSPTIPETPNIGAKKPETEASRVSDLVPSPSLDMPPRVSETRVALQIGFDFGTYSTKVVVRRRGERVGNAICVGGSVDGYPSFAAPSLVRVSDDTVWFGGGALTHQGERFTNS